MIKRYATPYEYFVLPFDINQISNLRITYLQNEQIILEKGKSDITLYKPDELDNAVMDEETKRRYKRLKDRYANLCIAAVHLTQEETAQFIFHKAAEKNLALIQIHLLDAKEDAFVSQPIHVRVYGSLNEGVI